jgi:hypothetical protein
MKITNVKIYDLEESLKASGYPMLLNIDEATEDYKRGQRLGKTKPGTGHNNWMKGVRVSFDITYSQYWSMQFQRYNHVDIVSSQSKMHRLCKMDISSQCNKYVSGESINNLQTIIRHYNDNPTKENYMYVISNCPMGLELTMRVSTNYLQLKTIYHQRKTHRLEDWSIFCKWVETLPQFKYFNNIN